MAYVPIVSYQNQVICYQQTTMPLSSTYHKIEKILTRKIKVQTT